MKPMFLALGVVLVAGCRREMFEQPRGNPLAASDFFSDGAASRLPPPLTVAREDFEGATGPGGLAAPTNAAPGFPVPITREILARGRERFDIYCSVCHGRTGQGNGMIVQRGFPAPPSYDLPRLREAPPGYFVDVITRGHGAMFSYANRVELKDRWAIAAYIRALQLSRRATMADVPPAERGKLEAQR